MKIIITAIIIALILREILSFCKDRKLQRESMDMSREVESINDKIREDRSFMRDLEREQRRQARDAEMERVRQAAEIERIAKEQEKQAAQLAKHEERLFKLEQKLELAARDEEHWSEEASAIRIDMAGLEAYINYCKSKGLLCKGKEDELAKKRGKLYAAETKLIKARQARELCEMQMSA